MDLIILILKNLVPIVATLTLIKAIIEYRRNQLWKESEFLSKEVKDFFSDEKVKTVLTLLDWNARKIMINGKEVRINDDFLVEALKTHNKKSRFTIEEAHCRDLFDNFFDKLSQFNIHCKNGLVTEDKIFNYFEYYFNILTSSERKTKEFQRCIDNYIDYYDYTNVKDLLSKYKSKKRP